MPILLLELTSNSNPRSATMIGCKSGEPFRTSFPLQWSGDKIGDDRKNSLGHGGFPGSIRLSFHVYLSS